MSTIFSGAIPTNQAGFGGTIGNDFIVNHTGTVDALLWYQPTLLPAATSVTVGLYDTETAVLLGSAASVGALVAGTWNSVALPAPIALTPGKVYRAAAFQNQQIAWFGNMLNGVYRFASPFTVMEHGGRTSGGGALTFPTFFTNDAYAVDVNFTATEPCAPCPPCPPTEGFLINLTSPGFIHVVTGVGSCVIEALGQTPAGAPCRQCSLVPTSVFAWDGCCDCPGDGNGQVALAIREVYGSDTFPQPMSGKTWTNCGPRYSVARVAVSVTRCLPAVGQDGAAPDCAAELAAAVTLENDRTAVRQAIACCLNSAHITTPALVNQWLILGSTTLPESGGCGGLETEFLVAVQSCLCP